MEHYFVDYFKFLLLKNPVHLHEKMISVQDLYDLNFDGENVIEELIEKELHDKFYLPYSKIFIYASNKLGIKHKISKNRIIELEEVKLLRNQFVHADGKVNRVYLRKARKPEALGVQGDLKIGDEIELSDIILEKVNKVVRTVLNQFDEQ
jgi:hypothetical protein